MAQSAIPFEASRMSNTDPKPAVAREKGARSKIEMIMLFGWGALLIFSLTRSCGESPRFLKPVTNAEPYIWPEGCPRRQYEDSRLEPITPACKVKKYIIKNWYERGLPSASYIDKSSDFYYRVGNDAVGIKCSLIKYGDCWASRVERDFFLVKNVSEHSNGL
jgi:hypothetical protein